MAARWSNLDKARSGWKCSFGRDGIKSKGGMRDLRSQYSPCGATRSFELTCFFLSQLTKGLCQDLILSNDTRLIGQKRYIEETDIYEKYRGQDCQYVNQAYFPHPHPTAEEMNMSIAYVIVAYKGAGLLERLLRAIYMPQNIYCLHLDKKSPEIFKRAVHSFVRCLPNVFVTKKLVDVVWGHISVLQAELNCMEDLLDSSVPWKYLITLVAQDFPLYDNKGIVQGLKQLNGLNNIESYVMPCLLYTSPSPRDLSTSRMPSSA